jgi:hypothetical protein
LQFLRRTAASLCWVLAGVGAVLLLFGGLFLVRRAEVATAAIEVPRFVEVWETPPAPAPAIPPFHVAPATVASVAHRVPSAPQEDRSVDVSAAERPAWLVTGSNQRGEVTSTVLASKQYATEAEARSDADSQVSALVIRDFEPLRASAGVQPLTLPVHSGNVADVIKDRHTEVTEHDFGTFFAPMYRVWYRVETSPASRSEVFHRWQGELQQTRVWTVWAAGAALLCIPGGILLAGFLTRLAGPQSRAVFAPAMGAAVITAWMVGAMVLSRFVRFG